MAHALAGRLGGCHNFVGGGVSRTMVKYGDRGVRYVHIEAGHASPATCIMQAESLDSGVCESGAIYCEEVSELFALPEGEIPIYVLSVGAVRDEPAAEG